MADAHTSIVTLFEDVTKALSDKLSFGYGSGDDFNSLKNKKFGYVWLDPITGTFGTVDSQVGSTIEWAISINFVDLDEKAGNEKETAKVWSSEFQMMEKWLHKLDQMFLNPSEDDPNYTLNTIASQGVEIQNPQFTNRRKITKELASGWNLKFTFITQTTFDYCSIYE